MRGFFFHFYECIYDDTQGLCFTGMRRRKLRGHCDSQVICSAAGHPANLCTGLKRPCATHPASVAWHDIPTLFVPTPPMNRTSNVPFRIRDTSNPHLPPLPPSSRGLVEKKKSPRIGEEELQVTLGRSPSAHGAEAAGGTHGSRSAYAGLPPLLGHVDGGALGHDLEREAGRAGDAHGLDGAATTGLDVAGDAALANVELGNRLVVEDNVAGSPVSFFFILGIVGNEMGALTRCGRCTGLRGWRRGSSPCWRASGRPRDIAGGLRSEDSSSAGRGRR